MRRTGRRLVTGERHQRSRARRVTLNGNATTVVDATHWSYTLDAAAITAFGRARRR